jgi:hypothetical protein
MHVHEAQRTLGSRFVWIVDNMDNAFKSAMGNAPNSEWVIDENNIIVRRRDWSSAKALRKDLEELVGPVDHVTRVEDLDMPTAPPPMAAARGVVERIERQGRMSPLSIKPIAGEDGEPFYAKLRAEADRDLLSGGDGQLYLRFMLDPLYKVHWNNLVDPIQVKIETPDGVLVSKNVLVGPKVEEEADIDPREFLIDVAGIEEGSVLKVSAFYYACHETAGWCKPVSQSYEVTFDRNRNGGSVIPSRMQRMMDRGRPGGGRQGAPRPPRGRGDAGDRSGGREGGADRGLRRALGSWDMATDLNGETIEAVMTLKMVDGKLAGTWESRGMEMALDDLTLDGKTLSFSRSIGEQSLTFNGTIEGNTIKGTYTGGFGELTCNGKRDAR